jgi:DNA polymerase III alpha subunit
VKIKKIASHSISQIDPSIHLHQNVTVGGIIRDIRRVFTKKNNHEMAFATLEDDSGQVDLVVFPRLYSQTKTFWVPEKAVLVSGKVDLKDDRLSILVETVTIPSQKVINVTITAKTPKSVLIKLNQLLQLKPGADIVCLELQKDHDSKKIKLPFTVNFSAIKSSIIKLIKPYGGKID